MALVMLKDVEVARVNRTGYGVKVVEVSEYKGEKKKTWWTVWFTEAHNLSEGDRITVSGFHSDKVSDPYTDSNGVERRAVERSLNNPRLGEGTAKAAPAADAWTEKVSAPAGDDTPF